MRAEYSPDQLIHARRMLGEERTELTRLRHELAVERFRRLTAEIELAVAKGDRVAHERACKERMGLGLTWAEFEIAMERKGA